MKRPKSSIQRNKKINLDFEEKNENNENHKRPIPINTMSYLCNESNSSLKLDNKNSFKEDYLINEQLNLLENIWNSLGITPEYRISFINNISNITSSSKKDIILQEKYNMKKLRESLIELKKEIFYRENNIDLLKKYNNTLVNTFNKDNSINNAIEEITSIIKKLRKNALNIVTKMVKLNKIIKEYLNSGKINFNIIRKEYSYNPNYLNKMKNDLSFLQNSIISKYIEMNNSIINPFLTNCAPNLNTLNYSNKINIPIPEELINIIKNAEYLLMQETLTYNPNEFNDFRTEKEFKEMNKKFNMNFYNEYNNRKYLKKNNKSFVNNSSKKLRKKDLFISDLNMSSQALKMKNKYGQEKYNNIFLKINNNHSKNFNNFKEGKSIKSNYIKLNNNYNIPQRKIRIHREELNYLTSNEFINNLNQFQIKYIQNYDENKEILRSKYNGDFEEEIDKFKPLEEIEEQEKISLEKEVENLKNKLKKMSEKSKEYEEELKQMNIKRKKKEKELNDKIENLEKKNNDAHEQIKVFKEKLKNEENLRISKEKEIEFMKIKIKEEEKKRIEEEKKRKIEEEEKIKQNEILENIKEEKRKKELEELKVKNEEKVNQLKKIMEEQKIIFEEEKEKIKEEINKKEELINKINEEKTNNEKEKLNLENELNSVKLEKSNLEINLKEVNDKLENNFNILNEQKVNAAKDYNLIKEEKNKIENDCNILKEEKDNLQNNYNILKEEYEKLKEKVEKLEKGILHTVNRNKSMVEYKINYYTGNISNLINILIDKISLEMIPDFIKRAFLINENIFKEEYYFKGIFPKIILSKKSESENSVRGICSLYYDSNENLNSPILRINSIFAIEDWENQIIKMIDFIKNNMEFKRLEIYLLYDKIEDKFIPNQEAKDIFQKGLGFKWLCVVRDEKLQQRYIKLYYEKEKQPQEDKKNEEKIKNDENTKNEENIQKKVNLATNENIKNNITVENIIKNENITNDENTKKDKNEIKIEDNKIKNDENKKIERLNYLCEKNNFSMDNLTIITINNEENIYFIKNMNNNSSKKKENYISLKRIYNKYINPTAIYSSILQNPQINAEFLEQNKLDELKEIKQKLWRFVNIDNRWNTSEEDNKKIENIKIDIENSLYREIEQKLSINNLRCSFDLYKNNLSINFESNYSLLIDDFYYNKITSDKIKILKERKTRSLFFLVPSNDNTVLFYITEVNKKLKQFLLEKDDNIYEKFLEFQPTTQKEIIEFSTTIYRNISYIPQLIKSSPKALYIPTFSINTHLFSYNLKNLENNIIMKETGTNKFLKLTSIDEYINVHFKPDENIKNSFTVIPVEDKKNFLIIKKSFLIGIFGNDILKKDKLPLLQFLYVTKEHFLTKNNYNPKS